MQVSNLWKIGISDYGEPAPHKQPLAELSDGIFWTMLQGAIVPATPSSLHADLSPCACAAAFSYIGSGAIRLHPLPQLLFLETGTRLAILSVRPSLPSACVTPGPYVPLIFTVFFYC